MVGFVCPKRLMLAVTALLFVTTGGRSQSGDGGGSVQPLSTTETLHYNVEWRLVNAGTLKLTIGPSGTAQYPSLHSELD